LVVDAAAGTGPTGTGGRRPGPEMMVALLLYGYCQGERSSRLIGKRCVRDVGYRVITGGLRPDHATIARFRARHETALGGLFSQVLRLLAAEGMVSLGTLSLDGTKLAGNAAQKANKTLPQTGQAARRGSRGRRRRKPGLVC
jgi:transposase